MDRKLGITALLLLCSSILMAETGGEIAQLSSKLMWITIILVVLLLSLIAFQVYLFWKMKKTRRRLKDELISLMDKKIYATQTNNNSGGRNYEDLEKRVIKLQQEMNNLKSCNKQVEINKPGNIQQQTNYSNSEVKYLRMKSGIYLSQESHSQANSKYKVFDIQGNTAKFEFCGNELEAIANREAFFDNVCDDSNYYPNAKQVVNEQAGIVELQGDGKWKVITKAIIKFV